ncbi:hypothetical protein QBC47DRAFT_31847, partial [Echria macrotheca]
FVSFVVVTIIGPIDHIIHTLHVDIDTGFWLAPELSLRGTNTSIFIFHLSHPALKTNNLGSKNQSETWTQKESRQRLTSIDPTQGHQRPSPICKDETAHLQPREYLVAKTYQRALKLQQSPSDQIGKTDMLARREVVAEEVAEHEVAEIISDMSKSAGKGKSPVIVEAAGAGAASSTETARTSGTIGHSPREDRGREAGEELRHSGKDDARDGS